MEGMFLKESYVKHCVGEIQNCISLYDNYSGTLATHFKKPMGELQKTQSFNFIFIKKGCVEIDVNGSTHTIHQGDGITLTKNIAYNVKSVSNDCQYFAIELKEHFIEEVKLNQNLDINLGLIKLEKKGMIHNEFSKIHFSYFEHIYMSMLYWIKKTQHRYYYPIIKQFSSIIIIKTIYTLRSIEKEHVTNGKTVISRQHVIFEHFIKQLEQNADKHRDVKFYASVLNVTPKYLSAITHIYTGKSAISSIEDFVINKIKSIMAERTYSIQQICKLMNFSSQSFFGRYFKRITGLSPREYMLSINLY